MTDRCTCGRSWEHCRICGSRGIYRLQGQSEVMSARHGRPISVWKCRRCMNATSELTPCEAEVNAEVTEFMSKEKAEREMRNLPLEERLKRMIETGASVDEVKAAIIAAGYKVEEGQPVKPLVIENPVLPEGLTDEEIKAGWSVNEQGQRVAPMTFAEIVAQSKLKKEKENNDENNH
jgi:hypothetical protein